MTLIALITAVVGLIWALTRLQQSGFDLNALNPFLWMRRRAWEQKRNTRPVFALTEPIEVACVLIVAMAREGGELLKEDRERITNLFTQGLKLPERQAQEMFALAEYLLREGPTITGDLDKVLAPSKTQFSPAQVESLRELLRRAPAHPGYFTPRQEKLLSEFNAFHRVAEQNSGWARG